MILAAKNEKNTCSCFHHPQKFLHDLSEQFFATWVLFLNRIHKNERDKKFFCGNTYDT